MEYNDNCIWDINIVNDNCIWNINIVNGRKYSTKYNLG